MANKRNRTLEAKVASLVSDDEIAVNVGERDGVAVGCSAVIPREIEIRDPDTKEILGTVWRPLLRLEIVQVQEKLSVAQSIDIVDQAPSGSLAWRAHVMMTDETKKITSDSTLSDDRTVLVRPGDRILVTVSD